MTAPAHSDVTPHTPAQLVRLVAGREISTRIRDKGFLVGSAVLIVLILGMLIFQVAMNSGSDTTRIAVVGGSPAVTEALRAQGDAQGTDVEVVAYDDEAAARTAVEDGDVDAALLSPAGAQPELLVESGGGQTERLVQGAVQGMAISQQLAESGVTLQAPPEVDVVALDPNADADLEAAVVALVGVVVLYSLLILFGQFVAQGVVEEKSSRVVELLLSTIRPWQLMAGKVLGIGFVGLVQMIVIGGVGIAAALGLDVLSISTSAAIGTVVWLVVWYLLGFVVYSLVFAALAALVSRQEDVGGVITPALMFVIVGYVVGISVLPSDPDNTLAEVLSVIPVFAPTLMPMRLAMGGVPVWEAIVSVGLVLALIPALVWLSGRIYANAVMRSGAKVKLKDALRPA
jgi:ABC-2 type transport system permease protein